MAEFGDGGSESFWTHRPEAAGPDRGSTTGSRTGLRSDGTMRARAASRAARSTSWEVMPRSYSCCWTHRNVIGWSGIGDSRRARSGVDVVDVSTLGAGHGASTSGV